MKNKVYKKWINRFLKAVESVENKHEPFTYRHNKHRPVTGTYAKFLWHKLQPDCPFYDSPKFNRTCKYYFVDTLQGYITKRESVVKIKTPKKIIKNYRYILSIEGIEGLLYFTQPIAHCTQKGWACDFYDVNDVLLCVGVCPISCKNTSIDKLIDDNTIATYNSMAWDIINDFSLPTAEQRRKINDLLSDFVEICKL